MERVLPTPTPQAQLSNNSSSCHGTQCIHCKVRKHTLFEGLSDSGMEKIQHYKEKSQRCLEIGETLYHEKHHQEYVYVLTRGWVMAHRSVLNGKRQILYFALPGDILGFKSHHKRQIKHTVEALTQSNFCAFSGQNLQTILNQNNQARQNMFNILSDNMDACHQRLLAMGQKSAEERVAYLLLELYYRIIKKNPKDSLFVQRTVPFPLTQEHIAEATGISVVHANRVLRHLYKQNLIECRHHSLTLRDEKNLVALAQFQDETMLPN